MIIENFPIDTRYSRDVQHVYGSIRNDKGEEVPIDATPSKVARVYVHLDVCYTNDQRDKINALMVAVKDIQAEAGKSGKTVA